VEYAEEREALVIYIDFQSVFDESQLITLDHFFANWAYAIADEARVNPSSIDSIWESRATAKIKVTRFLEFILKQTSGTVALIMDEVDILLNTKFYNEFFALLRAWYNRRVLDNLWKKMNIVMSISTHPSLLIDDINQSPFNVGLGIALEDFTEAQVRDLNDRYGRPLSSEEIPKAMELLGGHPFLVRQALYTLVSEGIKWPELAAVADEENGPFGGHLRYYLELLHDDEDLLKAVRQVLIEESCPAGRALLRLTSACVVQKQGRRCTCRYDLYKRFFENHLL